MCFFVLYVVSKWPIERYRLKIAFYLTSQNQIIINGYKKICNGFINFVCACKFLERLNFYEPSRFYNF